MKTIIRDSPKFKILTLLLILDYTFLALDLSRDNVPAYADIKYTLISATAVIIFLFKKNTGCDSVSAIGLTFFLLFTSVFTLCNQFEPESAAILLGYYVAALFFFGACGDKGCLGLAIEKSLYIFGISYAICNSIQIFSPESYSDGKLQFQGTMANANALAGLSGLFFLFYFFGVRSCKKWKIFDLALSALYAIFMFMAMSRGAILSAALVWLICNSRKKDKRTILLGAFLLMILIGLLAGNMDTFSIFGRDITESTGRGDILNEYLSEYQNTYLIFGTGVSPNSGRLKTELSYADIILFSGVGALGFFLFLFRSLYIVFISTSDRSRSYQAVFLYIIIISILEGYAANVASMLSLLMYIIPGLAFSRNNYSKI